MRNADIRINNYLKKMAGPHLGNTFQRYRSYMVQNYADWTNQIVEIENTVKSILDANGVKIAIYPMYLAYAREIFSLKKRFGGLTLLQRADLVKEKWADAGLDAEILETIKREILGLNPPPPSQP